MTKAHPEIFVREPKNPILTAAMWPYPAHTIFNAGVCQMPDGTTLLLCRVEDRRGLSHLSVARSANGVDGWRIDPQPALAANPNDTDELWGFEDPRITWVPELGKFAIAFTAFGRGGPGVALALTTNFESYERIGLIMQPDDKDAALLPRRIDGRFALLHRPITESGAHVWMSFSEDLRHWGGDKLVLPARKGGWWDANRVGLSPPLIETERGWLMLYHGVRRTASGAIYRIGVALLDLERPHQCIARGHSWIFGPEEPYEQRGDVGNVVFPCGYTRDGDVLRLYYGAADTSIALATGSIRELLAWLDANGTPAERT